MAVVRGTKHNKLRLYRRPPNHHCSSKNVEGFIDCDYPIVIELPQLVIELYRLLIHAWFEVDFWRREMPYERSRLIEERFGLVVELIQKGCSTTAELANELNVSRGTVHRIIAELRRRGFAIRSVREEKGWSYEIALFPQNGKYEAGQ